MNQSNVAFIRISKKIVYFFSFFSICILPILVVGQAENVRPKEWAVQIKAASLNNLYQLNDSIYRSEQPNNKAFQELFSRGIKSILDLRKDHSDANDLKTIPIQQFNVSMRGEKFSDTEIVAALRILSTAPKPILVHCKHGADRTGVVIAMYRIIFQDWSREMALDELQNGGYHFHKIFKNIPAYIRNVNIPAIKNLVLSKNISADNAIPQ